MLNNILRGLFEWLYGLFLDLIAYCANALLGIMGTDLSYFETSVPIAKKMFPIFVAIGWALLIGNCVFQATKSMLSGLGFEGESPVTLFCRTSIFGFLLVFSRQICEIGLGIGGKVITVLGIPESITLNTPDTSTFTGAGDAGWVLVIICGFILGIQLIKLFFEIGERYVIVAVLTIMAPVGFSMGGSKSTKDVFAGYIRMYASMLLMMVFNVVFLKLILSALATMPSGTMVLPWCVLTVALAKVARKIDSIISKIGLNPAITGDSMGRGGGGLVSAMVVRSMMSAVSRNKGAKMGGGAKARTPGGASFNSSHNRSTANVVSATAVRASNNVNVGHTSPSNTQNSSNHSNASTAQSSLSTVQSSSQNGGGAYSGRQNLNIAGSMPSGSGANTNRFGAVGTKPPTGNRPAAIKSGKPNANKPTPSKASKPGAKPNAAKPAAFNKKPQSNSNKPKQQSAFNKTSTRGSFKQNKNPYANALKGKNGNINRYPMKTQKAPDVKTPAEKPANITEPTPDNKGGDSNE